MAESNGVSRRVVITGMGTVSPLGRSPEALWTALAEGRSGVRALPSPQHPGLPIPAGGTIEDFVGHIDDFGPMEADDIKKAIKKGIRLMCREIQMGVAAAQLALAHSGYKCKAHDPERRGVSFGAGFMLTQPDDFSSAIQACVDPEHAFHFEQWGESGLRKVNPLWLLKYLPNMPACHIAIYNDFRGPNNSLTQGETAGNVALGEAAAVIGRGHAEVILAGATGTRLHPLRTTHVALQDEIAAPREGEAPAELCRPFDRDRHGMVLGEGAGAMILEELAFARSRGATIYGEIVGWGSACVGRKYGDQRRRMALAGAIRQALRTAGMKPSQLGHIHAHGLGTKLGDLAEAQALVDVFGSDLAGIPVVAAKSHFGNLGAGSGVVEATAGTMSLVRGTLFPVLNYRTPDPACPLTVNVSADRPAGDSFLNLSVSAAGQASCLIVRKLVD